MSDYCYPPTAPHMPPFHRKASIVLLLPALYPVDLAAAVNFPQCFENVISCANDSSSQTCVSMTISNITALSLLRTSKGTSVITTDEATALSYTGCEEYCGGGQQPFDWNTFSQQYAAWLLPYLALLSQLPFGARRRMDNLMSAILTLGSPTLAGYSLYLTLLNGRWVNDQLFSGVNYPSAAVRQSVVRVLNGLQQVPLRIHPGRSALFESLVVHPDNDNWWATLAAELDFLHAWSIASAASITWVVIAYLLTVADSLSSIAANINSAGEGTVLSLGTGSVWLWLLPIVVGWLVLSPKCDYDRVHASYHKANRQVFVASSRDLSADPTHVTTNFGLTITSSPEWELYDRNITSPDESRIPPIFNYARTLSWSRTVYMTSLFYRAAWRKASHRIGVDGGRIPWSVLDDVPRESRLGNHDQIIDYCRPDDHEYPGVNVLWPRGVLFNMVVASLMSLLLQWGTTVAAILTVWFTPTTGLGCRSLVYMIYGLISTTVWILLVSSGVLGYHAHRHLIDDLPTPDTSTEGDGQRTPLVGGSISIPLQDIQPPNAVVGECSSPNTDELASVTILKYSHVGQMHARTMEQVADRLRWIGKSLATVNAIGIIANSIFQYAGVYNNCYCDASVFSWGVSYAFVVISPIQSDFDIAKKAWIGALALAFTSLSYFLYLSTKIPGKGMACGVRHGPGKEPT
ncbi:hypothetical protein HD554DRAFT_1150584 [Boletus coccyginus]|nr:hypothetical protein HD554DRAFT_1150584 [Boletus coccyginus]